MARTLRRLGAACARHPLRVVIAWLVAAAVLAGLAASVGGQLSDARSLPGSEVAAADARLAAHFPSAADESADVLIHAATQADVRAAIGAIRPRIAALPHVVPAASGGVRWGDAGRTALVRVQYDEPRFALRHADLTALQDAARAPTAETFVTGSLYNDVETPGAGRAEKVGIAVAVVVLVLAFGSVVAALMPVATAALAIVVGLALVHLLADGYQVSSSAPALATMLGLGVGIDYALFIVTRHREGLRQGVDPVTAAAAATASAGSSVLWAGVTVVAAICGLAFAGIPLVTSLGVASAVVVAVSVLTALTLLPALLALAGDRIDRLHLGRRPPAAGAVPGWTRWAAAIERRPWRYLVGSVVLLGVLAVPAGAMRLGLPDAGSAKPGSNARTAFALMAHAFGPGSTAPLTVVMSVPPQQSPAYVGSAVRRALAPDPDVASVHGFATSADRTTAVLQVVPRTDPQSAATADLVQRLRDRLLPPVETATAAQAWVTGLPAGHYDVAQRVLDRLPWFVGAVLGLSFLLLMLVFRSLLVPLKAVLLNLLSIAAALGVVVAVFQWGWGRALMGVAEPVPVVDVIPMLMFAIVFGLSMDYEVFLLSRVREEWVLGHGGRGSVVRGLAATGRVISAAAAIMVAVFVAFTLSADVIVKMMGLGLAVAVFLDATVIRLVLVPATMALLGDANWWVPRWLDRVLPHVDIDAAVPVTPQHDQPTEAPIARPTV